VDQKKQEEACQYQDFFEEIRSGIKKASYVQRRKEIVKNPPEADF
jgi:hypothetical protein